MPKAMGTQAATARRRLPRAPIAQCFDDRRPDRRGPRRRKAADRRCGARRPWSRHSPVFGPTCRPAPPRGSTPCDLVGEHKNYRTVCIAAANRNGCRNLKKCTSTGATLGHPGNRTSRRTSWRTCGLHFDCTTYRSAVRQSIQQRAVQTRLRGGTRLPRRGGHRGRSGDDRRPSKPEGQCRRAFTLDLFIFTLTFASEPDCTRCAPERSGSSYEQRHGRLFESRPGAPKRHAPSNKIDQTRLQDVDPAASELRIEAAAPGVHVLAA